MTDTSAFDDLATAWNGFQHECWDEWNAFIASAQTGDWNESLQRQLEMFEHLGSAAIELRRECVRAGIKSLEGGDSRAPLPRQGLQAIRGQAERWFETERQAFGTWMDASRSLYPSGPGASKLPPSLEGAVETWRNTAGQLFKLQSAWLEAAGSAGTPSGRTRQSEKPRTSATTKTERSSKQSASSKSAAGG